MRLMDKFRQMMVGRYGADQFSMALIICYLVLSMIGSFTHSLILITMSYGVFVYCMFRTLSKNTSKRYLENQKFLYYFDPIKKKFVGKKKQLQDKTHCYYKCKNCGQTIRVPKGKGKIVITCPKCRQEFIKKT